MDQGDFAFVKAHGANMRGVSCVGTIFAFATLTGGPQEWFTLAQSDCSGANFYRAELTYADFSWSDLSVANMQVDRHLDIACRSTPASLTHSPVTICRSTPFIAHAHTTRSQESQHNVVDFGYAKLTNAKFARSMVNSIRAIEVRRATRPPHEWHLSRRHRGPFMRLP